MFCGSAESVRVLFNSRSPRFPDGLANSSGRLGKYIMDNVGSRLVGQVPLLENLPPHNEDGAGGAHAYIPFWLYREQLADIPWLRLPERPVNGVHGWQSFVCYVDEGIAPASRNSIMERLQANGISTRPGTHAVHMLGYYRERFGLRDEDFPAARDCDTFSMAIPLHNRMSAEDYHYVVAALRGLG